MIRAWALRGNPSDFPYPAPHRPLTAPARHARHSGLAMEAPTHREQSAALYRRRSCIAERFARAWGKSMKRSVLMLRPSYEGWKLLDQGRPVFWFPEKSAAIEVANTIAEARHIYSNEPTGVEVETEGAVTERVSTYG